MAWRLFKSISLGLAKINLSRSGVGVSFGMKGLRFGISGSKRPYVSYRLGPLSYFKYLSGRSAGSRGEADATPFDSPPMDALIESRDGTKTLTANEAILRRLREKK
jgi:hypothetical protein